MCGTCVDPPSAGPDQSGPGGDAPQPERTSDAIQRATHRAYKKVTGETTTVNRSTAGKSLCMDHQHGGMCVYELACTPYMYYTADMCAIVISKYEYETDTP
jgi:hypothetical protein